MWKTGRRAISTTCKVGRRRTPELCCDRSPVGDTTWHSGDATWLQFQHERREHPCVMLATCVGTISRTRWRRTRRRGRLERSGQLVVAGWEEVRRVRVGEEHRADIAEEAQPPHPRPAPRLLHQEADHPHEHERPQVRQAVHHTC